MTAVDTVTGEIVESSAALPAPMSRDAASVVQHLEQARAFLAVAVEMTGPAEIAMVKAQVVMAETYARELQLSKEIQEDAKEMVRRAEYALGKAIRKGQAEGTVRRAGERGASGDGYSRVRNGRREVVQEACGNSTNSLKASPTDFASHDELVTAAYPLAEATDGQFEQAITEAKSEGNLSRAHVVRKVKNQQGGPTTREQRADLITKLANEGYSSRQMPAKVGVSEETVRQIARDFEIDIPADRVVSRTRRINSTHVVVNTATALEGLVSGVELIDYDSLDLEEVRQWATSLTDSLRVLNRFAKQIKEMTQ